MAITRHSLIADEGKPYYWLLALLPVAGWYWLHELALLLFLPSLFMVWLFRDPRRVIPSIPLGVVSPVDGEVISIAEVHDPYLDRPARHIVIQMSLFGVNSLRSITEGKVINTLRGQNDDAERAVHVQTDEGDDVVVVLRPGRWLGRLSCHVNTGERIGQGQRCGHILFGAQIDIYLPAKSRVDIEVGQQLRAGSDLLGEFIHG